MFKAWHLWRYYYGQFLYILHSRYSVEHKEEENKDIELLRYVRDAIRKHPNGISVRDIYKSEVRAIQSVETARAKANHRKPDPSSYALSLINELVDQGFCKLEKKGKGSLVVPVAAKVSLDHVNSDTATIQSCTATDINRHSSGNGNGHSDSIELDVDESGVVFQAN